VQFSAPFNKNKTLKKSNFPQLSTQTVQAWQTQPANVWQTTPIQTKKVKQQQSSALVPKINLRSEMGLSPDTTLALPNSQLVYELQESVKQMRDEIQGMQELAEEERQFALTFREQIVEDLKEQREEIKETSQLQIQQMTSSITTELQRNISNFSQMADQRHEDMKTWFLSMLKTSNSQLKEGTRVHSDSSPEKDIEQNQVKQSVKATRSKC